MSNHRTKTNFNYYDENKKEDVNKSPSRDQSGTDGEPETPEKNEGRPPAQVTTPISERNPIQSREDIKSTYGEKPLRALVKFQARVRGYLVRRPKAVLKNEECRFQPDIGPRQSTEPITAEDHDIEIEIGNLKKKIGEAKTFLTEIMTQLDGTFQLISRKRKAEHKLEEQSQSKKSKKRRI